MVLDLRKLPTISDYFVIASGTSPRQLQAMADAVEEQLEAAGHRLNHVEGDGGATWVLMDCGDVVVHLFDAEARLFYNLERLWGDAPRLSLGTDSRP